MKICINPHCREEILTGTYCPSCLWAANFGFKTGTGLMFLMGLFSWLIKHFA